VTVSITGPGIRAHKVSNRGERNARVLMFSSAGNPEDKVILRRADGHVDYYDGEA
jgi:hypothetical protein